MADIPGNKPDFHAAMKTNDAKAFYADFLQSVRTAYEAEKVKDGEFGAMMQVHLVNDGPVTLELEKEFAAPEKKEVPL